MSRVQSAVNMAQNQFFQVIDRFVKEYYAEYDPSIYERTYQLYRSLVKSEIRVSGSSVEAEVYFDAGQLDYAMKTITSFPVDGGFMNPFNHAVSPSGVFSNPKGSGEKTLEAAAHGGHGGKSSGTAIWDDPMNILHTQGYQILKNMLIAAGLPIR